MTIDRREVQSSNAAQPIVKTLFGRVTVSRDEQPKKAECGIAVVVLSGRVTDVSELQPSHKLVSVPSTETPSGARAELETPKQTKIIYGARF